MFANGHLADRAELDILPSLALLFFINKCANLFINSDTPTSVMAFSVPVTDLSSSSVGHQRRASPALLGTEKIKIDRLDYTRAWPGQNENKTLMIQNADA